MENTALFSSEFNRGSSIKKRRLWEISCKLHRKTLIIFTLLIFIASVLITVAIIHHYSSGDTVLTTISAMVEKNSGATTLVTRSHANLEHSLTIVAIALISVLFLFMFFFIRHIIKPLCKLEKISREMADGRLGLLIQDNKTSSGAIYAIGENINSLAMNLQEVLLLAWNLSEHNLVKVEQTLEIIEGADEIAKEQIKANLHSLKSELEQMQSLTQQFELFDVTLQGKKALAKDDAENFVNN